MCLRKKMNWRGAFRPFPSPHTDPASSELLFSHSLLQGPTHHMALSPTILLFNAFFVVLIASAAALDQGGDILRPQPVPLLASYRLTGPSSRPVGSVKEASSGSDKCLQAILEVFAYNYTNSVPVRANVPVFQAYLVPILLLLPRFALSTMLT